MSAENEPRAIAAVPNQNGALEARLEALDARLLHLEQPEEKTGLARMQKGASFIALIVGIFLSVISLFDVFVSKPREAMLHDMEEFNKSVNAVASLRQSMVQVQYQFQNNPQMLMDLNSMVTPQVLANVQYATALIPRLGDNVGVPQLIVLLNEAMNIYDWRSARILVDRATTLKDSIPTMQSEAFRYKGRLMFLTAKAQDGRAAYESALSALGNESSFGIDGARAYVLADWIVAEYAMGDCSVGSDKTKRFLELTRDITPALRLGLVSSLRSRLGQIDLAARRCQVPAELQSSG